MKYQLIQEIEQQNPWLRDVAQPINPVLHYLPRLQMKSLLDPELDNLCTLLVGPRRAGKTTLGRQLSQVLIEDGRFKQLLYLNCDLRSVREWLQSPLFIHEAMTYFQLTSPIVFIDEVQRLPEPGLLLKVLSDLHLPIKMIASGSSQLEIKSKVQEHLTGRNFSSLVLPLSFLEWDAADHIDDLMLFGAYPQIVSAVKKELLLSQIYQDYISKDIIEFLKIGQPDTFQKLIGLLAHSSGQLLNYNQLATDCQISVMLLKNYLTVLQQTYVISLVSPFVGNKRTELTSNPIVYFIDNGFRNYALRNFQDLDSRTDAGLLVENLVYQEIYKTITQRFLNYPIHYWRTKSGAEVDFVVYKNDESFLPVEVKYRTMSSPTVSRGYRSFLQAYRPKHAVTITKDYLYSEKIDGTEMHFIPLPLLGDLFPFIEQL